MSRAVATVSRQPVSRPTADEAVTVAAYVHGLARRYGIRYERTALDTWAEAVTRAAGDDVVLNDTEELLVALTKAGHISDIDSTRLHARYLDERESSVA